jgi:hypothetical protein
MAVSYGKKIRRRSLQPKALRAPRVKPIALPNGRFACSYCDRNYASKNTCSSHLKFHFGLTRCPSCKKSFATKGVLAVHLKSCLDTRDVNLQTPTKVACKICDKKIGIRCINRHIQLVHKIDPEIVKSMDTEPVVILQKRHSRSSLIAPVPEVHQLEQNPVFEKGGKYFCNKCCKVFADKETCKIHTALHYSVDELSA